MSAIYINRGVVIEAAQPGTVVLDAQGTSSTKRRVIYVASGATVELIGLNITGGWAEVSAHAHLALAILAAVMSRP